MQRTERIRRRDRNVSLVRRITIAVSAGSLALAAGIGAFLANGHTGKADTTSDDSTGTGTGTGTDQGGGFQQPWQPPGPGSSGGSGGVTSGGS